MYLFLPRLPVELLKLDKAKQELKSKDDALRKSVENFHNLEDKAKAKGQLCKTQEEKLNELENQLSSKAELCKQLERQLWQLSERMMEKEEICSNSQLKVDCHLKILVLYLFTLFCFQINQMPVFTCIFTAGCGAREQTERACSESDSILVSTEKGFA